MMNPFTLMVAALAAMQGKSHRRRKYCQQRWDWRRGPTPKTGSRRHRAMMAARERSAGEGIDFYLNANDDRAEFIKMAKEKGWSIAQAQKLAF